VGYLTEDEIAELLNVGEQAIEFMNNRAASLYKTDYKEAFKLMADMYEKLERDNANMRKTLQKIASMAAHQVDEVDNTR